MLIIKEKWEKSKSDNKENSEGGEKYREKKRR